MTAARALPYPSSTAIDGLRWTGDALRYPGTNSDMHWHAWCADGSLLVVDDDGWNFDGAWNFAHALRVTGVPPDHRVEPLADLHVLRRGDSLRRRRYVCGALAVDDRLYIAAYDYDASSDTKPFWFMNMLSKHRGVIALMWSDDGGRSWSNVPAPDDEPILGERFAGLAFVGFGPGYRDVPGAYEGYVYAISNDRNWESGDAVFLARVPRARVAERAAWEFWAGSGEGHAVVPAAWTAEEEAARAILRDPGFVGHPTMTWSPGLGRFLLQYSTDAVPHSEDTPLEIARTTWDRRSELVMLEGPTPWGPWAVHHHDPAWHGSETAYLPQVPAAWLSADGRRGWMLYSGSYTVPDARGALYGFVTRPFALERATQP